MTHRFLLGLVAAVAAGMVLATPASADSLPGKGEAPGDVSITDNGSSANYMLVCGNGDTADYGPLSTGESRHVTRYAIGTCNGQEIWVTAAGKTLCKGLTNYRTDYAPISFQTNPDNGACALDGTAPAEKPAEKPAGQATGSGTGSGGAYLIGGWVGDDGKDNNRKVILGLHAIGTNEDTVDYWCGQVKDRDLGGVFVSFIEKMPPALYRRLQQCLK